MQKAPGVKAGGFVFVEMEVKRGRKPPHKKIVPSPNRITKIKQILSFGEGMVR